MSRIRQIKPSWFLDKELRRGTTADAREFYIGLWMLADDDGWLVWDVERIGAELYPYVSVHKRERDVQKWAEVLANINADHPHLVVYDCKHAVVPKMKAHQRIAGTRSTKIREIHQAECRHVRSQSSLQMATHAQTEARSHKGLLVATVGNGKERNGTSREATPPEGGLAQSEWQERVPRLTALGES